MLCVAILLVTFRLTHGRGDPFAVQVLTAIVDVSAAPDKGVLWFADSSQTVLSPINYALFVRITNLQPFPAKVQSYAVEAEGTNADWLHLVRINAQTGFIYFARDLAKASRFDVTANNLDSLLEAKPLESHGTVEGWSFFELPAGTTVPDGPLRFRVTVRDAAGAEYVYKSPAKYAGAPGPDRDAIAGSTMHVVPGLFDLRGMRTDYYR